jgi:hypothetical protein
VLSSTGREAQFLPKALPYVCMYVHTLNEPLNFFLAAAGADDRLKGRRGVGSAKRNLKSEIF